MDAAYRYVERRARCTPLTTYDASAKKELVRFIECLFGDTPGLHTVGVVDSQQNDLWELKITFPDDTQESKMFDASINSLAKMEEQLIKWRSLSDGTQLPNKRSIFQWILDDIEPGWWIKKPSPTDPCDVESLCIFQKPDEYKEAQVLISNGPFQFYNPTEIRMMVRRAIREATVKRG